MKQSQSKLKKHYTLLAPSAEFPELMIRCPHCGGEVELWSDGEETTCIFCSQTIFGRTTTH